MMHKLIGELYNICCISRYKQCVGLILFFCDAVSQTRSF